MRVRKALVGLAVVAMLGMCGTAAFGDDTNSNSMNGGNGSVNGNDVVPPADQPVEPTPTPEPNPETPENPENPATPTPAVAPAAPTYGPLMHLFEAIGIGKPMEDLGFDIHGYVEAGYFYDMTVPHNLTPPRSAPGDLILFPGDYKNEFMLNQLDLTVERDMVNLSKGDWDFGGLVEVGYGRDFFYTHSNGILDQHNKQAANNGGEGTGNDDQLDILQAYAQLGIPLGTGITLEAGKFVSLLGYERIDPTQNIFYTHSYGFSYGEPFTITGALASYSFYDPNVNNGNVATLTGGVTRGWNQSLYDNNGSPDGVIQFKDKMGGLTLTGNVQFGPEGQLPYGPPNNSDWWIVPEGIMSWQISDQFLIAADLLYGDATHLTQWFSAAIYSQYRLDPHFALGSRVEYYHDGHGITTGVGGTDINYFEATLGATLTPFPDSPYLDTLALRPEVRDDYASSPVFDFSKYNEVTASFDIVYRY